MNIAIIDDFKDDQARISNSVKAYFAENCLENPQIHLFECAESFLKVFAPDTYDLVFIDYYLKEVTGLEIARRIRSCDTLVALIFVSVSSSFAVEGYIVRASGYLVKPFTYKDFSQTLKGLQLSKIQQRQFIKITDGYEQVKILLKDILYCDIHAHYVHIHTASMGTRRCRMTFTDLSKMLEPYSQFLICYRGCLVNMDHIIEAGDSDFRLSNGESVPFQQKKHQHILNAYWDYLFQKARGIQK